jgi:type IV pilus biogenesis protein CpaD/CtpE
MIFGAKQQVQNLKDAAKRPKDTSGRVVSAQNYSGKIVSDNKSSAKPASDTVNTVKPSGSDQIRGSYEGLQHSSSAHIQMSNTGYDAKKHQTARYGKEFTSHNNHNFNFKMDSLTSMNYNVVNNYSRLSSKDASNTVISNIVKDNMMFK